jgi:hypothetical protein
MIQELSLESEAKQSLVLEISWFQSASLAMKYLHLITSIYLAVLIQEEQKQASLTVATQHSKTSSTWLQLLQTVLKSLKVIVPWLWAVVIIVVIIPLIGEFFIAKAFQPSVSPQSPTMESVMPAKSTDWTQVKKAVHTGLQDARSSAENYASKELDAWVNDLVERVDNSFLDWYFGYFNQKQIEYKALFTGMSANMAHWLNPNSQLPEERVAEIITGDFQTEFAKRVLRPQISQIRLERITTQTVQHYLNEINLNIREIPKSQQVAQADWKRYLNDLSIDIVSVEGDMSRLSGKALLSGGAYVAFKPLLLKLLPTIGSKIAVKLAGKAGAKIAAKTGGVLASKVGSAFLDSTVGVGILLWDIWDNHHTATIEKPILRRSLVDYLLEVKASLVNNPDTGVMTVVDAIQQNIEHSLDIAQTFTSLN